jgi:hypothetical protein
MADTNGATGGDGFLGQYLEHMGNLKALHEQAAQRCAMEMRVARHRQRDEESQPANANGNLRLVCNALTTRGGRCQQAMRNGRCRFHHHGQQRKRSHISPAGKAAISRAQIRRWAKVRRAKEAAGAA